MKKVKKKVLFQILVLFLCSFLYGEEISVDSLKKKLEVSEDAERAVLFNELSQLLMDSDSQAAADYAEEALRWARQFNQDPAEARALENLGMIHNYTSDYKQALSYFENALIIYQELKDKEGLANSYRHIGSVYRERHKYSESMEYYKISLDIQIELGNQDQIGRALNNMGNIYNEQSRYHEALDYYQRALEIFKELKNDRAVAIILNNIAIIYKEFINSEKALKYCEQALEISKKTNSKRILSLTLNNMGFLYAELGKYSEALNLYEQSLNLLQELEYKERIAVTLNDIGWIYQKKGEYQKALDYHLQSAAIYEQISDELNIIGVYSKIGKAYLELENYELSRQYLEEAHSIILKHEHADKAAVWENYHYSSELYAASEEYKKAYEYYKSYRELRDTVFTENTSRFIIEMERKYNTAQREKENERLKKENNLLIAFFAGGFLLLVFLSVLLYIRYRQKLKEQEMKGRVTFFMNLAHEIKTPLTLIRSYFSRYKKKQEPSEFLDLIQYNLDTLIGYILNFFTLEKLERGEILYDHSQTIDLDTACKKITALTESACEEKGISIFYEGPGKDTYIRIDPNGLNTILYNLLQNAVKYTNRDGQIEVLMKELDTKVQLIVKDTGIGIEPKDIDSVFKPFARLLENKHEIEGLGLGLSIVKRIIDQVGGRIEIKSKPGEGTECIILFSKTIPGSDDEKETNIELSQVKIRMPREYKKVRHYKTKPTILIVEDEPDILCGIQDLFLEAGYNAYTAANGKDALEKLEKMPEPDVIISDIMMDTMNGYTFFDYISNNNSCNNISFDPPLNTVPFVFLSARSTVNEIIKGLRLGAVEFIPKPFDNDKLVARVDALVGYIRKREQAIRQESTKIMEEIKSIPINEKKCLEYNITDRQRDILRLRQQGLKYPEIADRFGIKDGGVRAQIHNIKEKTGMNDINMILQLFFYDNLE